MFFQASNMLDCGNSFGWRVVPCGNRDMQRALGPTK